MNKKTIITIIAATVAVVGILFSVLFVAGHSGKIERMHSIVEQELKEVAELTLYKMSYRDIVTIKRGGSLTFLSYKGTIRAGIADITAAEITISGSGRAVTVILPCSEILGNDISQQDVVAEYRSFFSGALPTQEIFSEINVAKKEMEQDVLKDGLLSDSDERARALVQRLLETLGFSEVTVTTRAKEVDSFAEQFSQALE